MAEPEERQSSNYGLGMVYNADLLTELTELATRLAKDAGAFLLAGVDRPREQITTKSSGTDMVSEMDKGAEDIWFRAFGLLVPTMGFWVKKAPAPKEPVG